MSVPLSVGARRDQKRVLAPCNRSYRGCELLSMGARNWTGLHKSSKALHTIEPSLQPSGSSSSWVMQCLWRSEGSLHHSAVCSSAPDFSSSLLVCSSYSGITFHYFSGNILFLPWNWYFLFHCLFHFCLCVCFDGNFHHGFMRQDALTFSGPFLTADWTGRLVGYRILYWYPFLMTSDMLLRCFCFHCNFPFEADIMFYPKYPLQLCVCVYAWWVCAHVEAKGSHLSVCSIAFCLILLR